MQRPGTSRTIAWITNRQKPLAILALIFLIVHITLWLMQGVEYGLEADKYISQGEILFSEGRLSESKFVFYLPVILLVWLTKVLGLPLVVVAIIQILFSGLAQYVFYRFMRSLASPATAFFASVGLLLFIPLQSWNLFLYSDSIFISFTLIYVWVLYRYRPGNWKDALLLLLALLALIISRPHGLLFIPPTLVYLLLLPQSRFLRMATAILSALVIIAMYLTMNMIFTGGSDMDALKPFVEEHIICFVPENPEGASVELLNSGNPTRDLLYYVLNNPMHFLRLMALRLYSFFNLCRPFYSDAHNIYLLLIMIPVYVLGLLGLIRSWSKTKPIIKYILLLLILYPLGATFQCDDWHSRFTMVVFPYFIYLASAGLFSLKPFRNLRQP